MNNKNERLIDSFGNIDDDIIESSLNYKKTITPWKKYVSIAACFAFVVVSVGIGWMFFGNKSSLDEFNDGNVPVDGGGPTNKNENADKDDNDGFKGESFEVLENVPSFPNRGDYSEENAKDEDLEDGVVGSTSSPSMEEDGDGVQEIPIPNGSENNIPSLKEEVKIDNLNKLAYYSGWTMLRKYGYYNSRFFANNFKGLKSLSKPIIYENGYGVDVSETDTPIYVESEISDEYSGLIPIDPGFGGEVIAYGIYELTVTSVEYFQIEIYNGCFLSEQLGEGRIEVMLLEVEFDNGVKENMLVFRNGERYFSCLEESFEQNAIGDKLFIFTASKYVSNFSIVKMPELSEYSFIVYFRYDGKKLSEIDFEYTEKQALTWNQKVSMKSYDFANNISVSNTAFGLDEELYKIYLEGVVAGVITPIMPEKPKLPESSEETYESSDIGISDALQYAVIDLALFEGKGAFETETGFSVVSFDSQQSVLIKKLFPNEEFCDFFEKLNNEHKWAIAWVKGRARISEYQAYSRSKDEIYLNFDYVLFGESENYTVFVFELLTDYTLTDVEFNPVSYSTTLIATFTTENEYDYLDGNEKEDEYIINLHNNVTYSLYKNDILIYSGEYKVSDGYVVLCTDDDVFYNELSPVSTFVYKIDGRNRIFKLI